LIAKGTSRRLPGKNLKPFNGKPTFLWNVEKCLQIFDRVYVSSDSDEILRIAQAVGAIPILRDESLCGDVPDIPVFQHALSHMPTDTGWVVAVHANNPTIRMEVIEQVREAIISGVGEVMTCRPMTRMSVYHAQYNQIYGSIRAFTTERLINYGNPYEPNPEVLVVDDSIEIETPESYQAALWQSRHRL
jgi:CMP-N-acetylneuraminic acid synthetase